MGRLWRNATFARGLGLPPAQRWVLPLGMGLPPAQRWESPLGTGTPVAKRHIRPWGARSLRLPLPYSYGLGTL
eukprot:10239945-Alexandrium_andersonii.AAC.1